MSNIVESVKGALSGSDGPAVAKPAVEKAPYITTNTGFPVFNHHQSETIGRRGPILLEDFQVIDKLAQFDRERIPERVVHAEGYSAKGYFEVTNDVTHLTCADLFSSVGKRTPVTTRFSTVIHPRGSSQGLRDPRGFAVKFYTEQGNWDIVGNNMPVFFQSDGISFPDLIHALKPDPITNVQEGWRIADYFSHWPESMHMFTWVYDDLGIPKNFRQMDGFGVNTFKLINAAGEQKLVKFHWKNRNGGIECLTDEEAYWEGGKNAMFASSDLYSAIEEGNYPTWDFYFQVMDEQEAAALDYDVLDVTKLWPEEQFPLIPVGRMVLDRNVDNFFAESEQLAFSPSVIVPGIGFTNDRMLQTRLFSYSDTTRYRLGANFLQIPINAPLKVNPVTTQEGVSPMLKRTGHVNYYPSSIEKTEMKEADPSVVRPEVEFNNRTEGPDHRVREHLPKENHFSQAGDRYRSFDPARRDRFIARIAGEKLLGAKKTTGEIKSRWINYFYQMDEEAGRKLEEALGMSGIGDGMKSMSVKADVTRAVEAVAAQEE